MCTTICKKETGRNAEARLTSGRSSSVIGTGWKGDQEQKGYPSRTSIYVLTWNLPSSTCYRRTLIGFCFDFSFAEFRTLPPSNLLNLLYLIGNIWDHQAGALLWTLQPSLRPDSAQFLDNDMTASSSTNQNGTSLKMRAKEEKTKFQTQMASLRFQYCRCCFLGLFIVSAL